MQGAHIYKSRGKYGASQQHLDSYLKQMKVRAVIPWVQVSPSAGGLFPRMVSSLDREEQNIKRGGASNSRSYGMKLSVIKQFV